MMYAHSLMDTTDLKPEHTRLEEDFWSTEARERNWPNPYRGFRKRLQLIAKGEDLSIWELVAALRGGGVRA